MIEDPQLLSRSDLEESLLKNLFSSVKNLESDVSLTKQQYLTPFGTLTLYLSTRL